MDKGQLKTYKHIYFDLDRTLWDYDNNSREALSEIINNHNLISEIKNFEQFWDSFVTNNEKVWEMFTKGLINKDVFRVKRFELVLNDFGINNPQLAGLLNQEFLKLGPTKTLLVNGAIDILTYLKNQKYHLYVLTNGFTNIQNLKMKSSSILRFFDKVFTVDNTGSSKPNRKMFERAVKSVNAKKTECLMIGDELNTDILGAQNFGIDQVYFNPDNINHDLKPTYEIASLYELKNII